MRKHLSLACALAVASSLLITSPASAAPTINTEPLRDCRYCGPASANISPLCEAIANAEPIRGRADPRYWDAWA